MADPTACRPANQPSLARKPQKKYKASRQRRGREAIHAGGYLVVCFHSIGGKQARDDAVGSARLHAMGRACLLREERWRADAGKKPVVVVDAR